MNGPGRRQAVRAAVSGSDIGKRERNDAVNRKHVNVAIIGAGSAGLSALRQVREKTEQFVLIDPGPLGTTCARIGCMPSKALIHVANEFHRRHQLAETGIAGAEHMTCDIPSVLRRVRRLRDQFAEGMAQTTHNLAGDRLVVGKARFLDAHRIEVGGDVIEADRTIVAVGSSPVVPSAWQPFSDRILTPEMLFDRESLPGRMAVIGLGAVGLELGQALHRLGVDVTAFHLTDTLGGLTDRKVSEALRQVLAGEIPIHLGAPAEVEPDGRRLRVVAGETAVAVDALLLAMGTNPNLKELGLENLGVPLDDRGLPAYDARTTQIGNLPVYIAGDANGCRPILHEALDEGFIAGRNAAAGQAECYCRRTPLRMAFCDPQVMVVGESFSSMGPDDLAIGEVDFTEQSRAVVEGQAKGLLRIYADRATGRLRGAEAACPGAEHVGHLLALAIQQEMTVPELLKIPFYHPTLEEAVRTALRDAAQHLSGGRGAPGPDLCGSCPESPVC